MNPSAASGIIQISGITVHLVDALEYPLLIKLTFDGANVTCVLLKRNARHKFTRSFQKPRTLHNGSVLTVQVKEKHREGDDKALLFHNHTLQDLWPRHDLAGALGSQVLKYELRCNDPKKQIWLNVNMLSSTSQSYPSNLDQNQPTLESDPYPLEDLKTARDTLLQKLTGLKSTLGGIGWAEHPFKHGLRPKVAKGELNMIMNDVLDCINGVHRLHESGYPCHKHVLALAEYMTGIVSTIQPVTDIFELNELKTTLKVFPDLIHEAADIFEIWLSQSVLASTSVTPSIKEKIDKLQRRFALFERDFDRAFKADEIHSYNATQELQDIKEYLLEGIKTVEPQAIECIPGTRIALLAEITSKTNNLDGSNITWICGSPGCGKSSLSLSAKSRLRNEDLLVTYFRFDRNQTSITTPKALWRLVAYDLACRLPSIRSQLLQLLREDKVDLESPIAVFTSLIEEPMSELTVDRPLVIVIDGLDECGGLMGRLSPDRQALIQTLRRWPQLPKYFKLLVTSREEGDLARVLSSISTAITIPSGTFLVENPQAEGSIHACNDIRMFLEGRFQCLRERIKSLPTDWPSVPTITDMVRLAAGNFMWATTAANFVDGKGIDPQSRLTKILGPASQSRTMQPLYSLYTTILETAFGDIADDSEAETLQIVLGIIVCARRPFYDTEYIQVVTAQSVTMDMLNSIRDGLRSVVASGDSLRFLHKSFDDFLLSKECPSIYRVNMEESEYLLSQFCLTTMTNGLRFNMCELKTSCRKNADVPDIETRINNGISSLLAYSCCFWAEHLYLTLLDEYIMVTVKEVALDKLLYWFEAMSLLKETSRISHSLLLILKWSHSSPDEEFKEFARDARQFIGTFIHPITQSAPHIYISALPFAPEYSLVARHFLPRFPSMLALSAGKPCNWSPCTFTSEDHKHDVNSVAFSPDEATFASGSDDAVCICDSETGNLILGPIRVDSLVLHVFFDPSGKRIWASCGRNLVVGWDVETGDEHIRFRARRAIGCYNLDSSSESKVIAITESEGIPNEMGVTPWSSTTGERLRDLLRFDKGPAGRVSVKTNGCYLASTGANSRDTTLRIWNLSNGRSIQAPSHSKPNFKHSAYISAVAFSVEDNFVVSGSNDGTILIWDATTGNVVGSPPSTRKARVTAVAYSPSCNVLVSATGDPGMVVIWDASTFEVVLGPLKGHTARITEIALSRNGRRALTSSLDGTVKMWDLARKGAAAATNANRSNANEGYTDIVRSVVFSPCGKKVASLGRHETMRVWDARSGELLVVIGNIPDSRFSEILFSPDGSYLVAYRLHDNSVQAWKVDTGEPLFHLLDPSGIDHVSFRLTSQQLVTSSYKGDVCVWSVEGRVTTEDTSAPIQSPQVADSSEPVEVIALSPDGTAGIVCDENRNFIWKISTGQCIPLSFAHDESFLRCPAVYSPSGQFFAVVSTEDPIVLRVWNTQTGEIAAGPFTLDDRVRCLAFSPDDQHIAFSYSPLTFDNTVIWIWSIRTGLLASEPWKGHVDLITALAFSSDGAYLVSGSYDGQIRIWDTADLLGDSQVAAGFMGVGTRMQDGWLLDGNGELIFWVPKDHRAGLVWPRNVAVFGGTGIPTQLDLTKFRCGDHWTESFGGQNTRADRSRDDNELRKVSRNLAHG